MVDIKNIPALLKTSCKFCVWKFEKRNGQKTKMPYNPANGERAKINDLHTFADFKTTLVAYAMGGYDGIGVAVGNGIGAFDIDKMHPGGRYAERHGGDRPLHLSYGICGALPVRERTAGLFLCAGGLCVRQNGLLHQQPQGWSGSLYARRDKPLRHRDGRCLLRR